MIVQLFDREVEAKEIDINTLMKINTAYDSDSLCRHFHHLQSNTDNFVFVSANEYYALKRQNGIAIVSINSVAQYVASRTSMYARKDIKEIIQNEGCQAINNYGDKKFCYVYGDKFLSYKK